MTLPFDVAVRATGARVLEPQRAPADVRVVTDTRTLKRGETFVALRGERFDGHDHVAAAVEAGAAAVVVDRDDARPAGVTSLLVRDTLAAYMALGGASRDRYRGRVVGITGSTGKTTTKALLAQLVATHERVLASPANENNEIGVAKLLLAASNDDDVVVVEMGARKFGDVAALVAIARPEIGVLTNVGEAHLEIMGSRERLEETKWGLFASGARAVLNQDDTLSQRRAPELSSPPLWFYAGDAPRKPAHGSLCALLDDGRLVLSGAIDRTECVDVRLPGKHNRENLAAAIAAAIALGVPVDAMLPVLPSLALPQGRFERITLPGGMHVIYDAYNASASGTIASLDAFAAEPARRHLAVLGGMAELGDEAEALHERIGSHAARAVDWLLVGGELAHATARGALQAGMARERIVEYATNHAAADWLREHVERDDLVLLKGSRKYQLEEIVEELRRT